jgi:hypothetical protein
VSYSLDLRSCAWGCTAQKGGRNAWEGVDGTVGVVRVVVTRKLMQDHQGCVGNLKLTGRLCGGSGGATTHV